MDFNDLLSNDDKKVFSESLKQLFKDTEKILDEEHPLEEVTKFNVSDISEPLCLNNLKNNPQYYYQKFKIIFIKFLTLEDYFFRMKKGNESILKKEKEDKKEISKFVKNINKFKKEIKQEIIKNKLNYRNKSVENKTNNKLNPIREIKDSIKRKLSENRKTNSLISDDSNQITPKNQISKRLINKISLTQSDTSEKTISDSFSYEQKQGLKGIGYNLNEKQKEFPDYKLKLIKYILNLEDNDKMSGKAYEDYARKIVNIMLIITTKKEIFFENPTKLIFSKIIDFY